MKRLFTSFALMALTAATLFVSCKKEENNGKGGGGTDPVITLVTIEVDPALKNISMAVNAEAQLIPVTLTTKTLDPSQTPRSVTVPNDVAVSCNPEGVVSCTLLSEGVQIAPQAVGTTTLTLSPKNGLIGSKVECEIEVSEEPDEPSSLQIEKTGPNFSGGVLQLAEGDSYQLKAVVTTKKGKTSLDYTVLWAVTSGSQYASVVQNTGLVTTKSLSGATNATGTIVAGVDGYNKLGLADQVDFRVQPAPTSVGLYQISLNNEGEYIAKKGTTKTFQYTLNPGAAFDDIEVIVSGNTNVTAVKTAASKEVTLTIGESSPNPATVTLRSKKNTSASKSFKVYSFDYEGSDVKTGDYVLYSSDLFLYADCGLRYQNGSTAIYVNNSGSRITQPRDLGTGLSTYFVGVVVSPIDYSLECTVLNNCENGPSATGVYEYRGLSLEDLSGLGTSKTHVLVVKKDQTDEVEWQHNNEYIAITTAKRDGLNQSQLHGWLAFSYQDYQSGYDIQGQTVTHYSFGRYVDSGFVPTLLQRFYSNHINNTNYKVIPIVDYIDKYSDVPKVGDGKGTTGWFLPGEKEWKFMRDNLKLVNASLSKASATTLSGMYWSTEERAEYQVNAYNVTSSGITLTLRYKDARTHTTEGKAHTRAVLIL
ncbi:MAG: hypothetical protein J6Y32_03720 [Bacteroidales bacterium]|nr:hypothetical protein [Bacteroidales bacterium]